jgi:hypothetical protein
MLIRYKARPVVYLATRKAQAFSGITLVDLLALQIKKFQCPILKLKKPAVRSNK